MKNRSGKYLIQLIVIFSLIWMPIMVFGQENPANVENLGFKIMQKQAAEYEQSLTDLLTGSIAKYIPDDRFHLTVRIYWNPDKVRKLQSKNSELKQQSGKLPGFPIFVRAEEQSIDYYLGAGSVMKLKIEVLIDEKLPPGYTDFIYQLVPIQARFVSERGDAVQITPIPFPKTTSKPKDLTKADVPFADDASMALLNSISKSQKQLDDIKPVILHPVLQRYVSEYEEYIEEKLGLLISEYVTKENFLLSLKFYWNPDEINNLKRLVVQSDAEGKIKLPGFNVYVEERDSLYKTIANSTTLMRMEITLMLNESVSPDVEPFLHRLIPMAVKFKPERGDKLTIYRGHFPRLGAKLKEIVAKSGDQKLKTDADLQAEIDESFETGEYRRSIVLIDLLLAKTTNSHMRLPLLKKKGTLHLLLQEKELALSAWNQVKEITPDDEEIKRLLEYIQ
jgi:hypothetical protein